MRHVKAGISLTCKILLYSPKCAKNTLIMEGDSVPMPLSFCIYCFPVVSNSVLHSWENKKQPLVLTFQAINLQARKTFLAKKKHHSILLSLTVLNSCQLNPNLIDHKIDHIIWQHFSSVTAKGFSHRVVIRSAQGWHPNM